VVQTDLTVLHAVNKHPTNRPNIGAPYRPNDKAVNDMQGRYEISLRNEMEPRRPVSIGGVPPFDSLGTLLSISWPACLTTLADLVQMFELVMQSTESLSDLVQRYRGTHKSHLVQNCEGLLCSEISATQTPDTPFLHAYYAEEMTCMTDTRPVTHPDCCELGQQAPRDVL
jgi:hypothetical protein